MAYRIDYQATKKVRGMEKRTASLPAVAAALVLGAILLWPRGAETLRGLLIPGDAVVTVAALEDLAVDLREGQSMEEALDAFCRQVAELGTP